MRRKMVFLLTLLLLISVSEARVYNVNFAGITREYPYFNAYDYNQETSAPPVPPSESSPPSGAREFSDTNYRNIWYPEGTTANPGYETHYFLFKLPQDAAVDRVEVHWRGAANDDNDLVRFFAYNNDTRSWTQLASITGDTLQWINYTFTDPDPYISPGGYMHLAFVGDPEGLFDGNGAPYTDYIELIVTVIDAYVQTACVQVISDNVRDWDGIFDSDTVSVRVRATTTGNEPIPWYTNLSLKAVWSYLGSGSAYFGSGMSNSTGEAVISGRPIDGGVTDRWRVSLKVAARDAIVDGVPYTGNSACSEVSFADNVAITPSSYNVTLIGRYWDNGGADWVRIWWVAEPSDVLPVNIGGYNLPVAQKFRNWDFLLYKIGAVNVIGPNNDNDNDWEGISSNVNEVNSEMYPACIGPDDNTTRPYNCGQWAGNCRDSRYVGLGLLGVLPAGCCVTESGGTMSAGNCARYETGYRISTLVEFNVPDHNLGEPGKAVYKICSEYGTLTRYLNMVPYPGHEGDQRAPCTSHLLSVVDLTVSPTSTEGFFRWTYSLLNMTIVRNHPHGGLGLLSFIGLWPDNQHVVGLVVGHRFGIHPFTALVTSMPPGTYPADGQASYWNLSFMQVWLYYLLKNLAYGIFVTAEEWANMHLRYPPSGEDNITALNRAINLVLGDFLPYLNETLWMLEASGNNTIKPFIVSTVTQLNDTKRIATLIRINETLRAEFVNLTGTLFGKLPELVGPPDASTGLNYLLKWRTEGLTYTEKRDTNALIYDLLDRLLSFAVAIMKHLPLMEYVNTPASPGWNFNWIENSTQP